MLRGFEDEYICHAINGTLYRTGNETHILVMCFI